MTSISLVLNASFILFLNKPLWPERIKANYNFKKLTYLIYTFTNNTESFSDDHEEHNFESEKECQLPTKNNPFMNTLLTDSPKRKRNCNINNKTIKKMINKNFKENLFNDIEDVFNRKNSQRQFYTMPSTTIPNNQDTFQKWLYKTPNTCKEGNGNQCVANTYEHPQI